jgi:hypothetical protein
MRSLWYRARLQTVEKQQLGEAAEEVKGVLLGLAVSGEPAAALDGLEGPEGDACRAAWRALGELDEPALNGLLDAWRAQASTGLPRDIDRLHPSWIEAALAGEPPCLLRYFHRALPEPLRPTVERLMREGREPSADVDLDRGLRWAVRRIALGHLAPLCESTCGPLATRLCAAGFDELQREVTHTGARTLGHSLVGASAAVRVRAMALAGEPWARVIGEALAEEISDSQRRAAIGHAAANVNASARTPTERLLYIGLAALKADLSVEGVGSLFRVAGRLPTDPGRQLLGW